MTIGEYFRCPSCGQEFAIKLQMDETYKVFDWPIHVSCPSCGTEMDFYFNAQGLQPKELLIKDADRCITMGYSAVLPLTKDLYFRNLSKNERIMASTPFMNFSFFNASFDAAGPLGAWASWLMSNLIPYRHYLAVLHPLITHEPCNVKAVSAKLAALSESPDYKELKNEEECIDAFMDLIHATYRNLVIRPYEGTMMKQHFNKMLGYLLKADKNQLSILKEKVVGVMNTHDWLWDEGTKTVADIVGGIQKLMPAMSFAVKGVFNVPSGEELYIMTVGYKEVDSWFASCYEALAHFLPFVVGLNNAYKNGDADKFVVDGLERAGILEDFAKLDASGRINAIRQDAELAAIYEPVLNNRIRNAIQHKGDKFNATTQTIVYHYDTTDDSKVMEYRLIDVAYMVFLQLLHLLEAIQFVGILEKRLRTI